MHLRMSFFFCNFAHFLCVVREYTRYAHGNNAYYLL